MFFREEPICPKHQKLLDLYCETEKEVVCVSCVYGGGPEHKGHKIKEV